MTAESTGETRAHAAPQHAKLLRAQRILVLAFVLVGLWYLHWRPSSFNPEAPAFSWLIYGAEVFGFGCALLYIFMCWALTRRRPPPAPEGLRVAAFIPTINEPVELVRRTLLAAKRMKYPHETWLLDDGNRPEMRALAEELGCRYLARTENAHAKAGNLNNALRHCDADYIAIFDADHAPAPGFLEDTLGFFTDERVAFVQTPQDFYNLDSFQHRARRGGSLVWNEQSLFFRVIQAGKDRLNSAFFCGSCAVIRRTALDDIGGFATGTVTEDIHTSLKLHKRGWHSVYYTRPLAFGVAPSTAIPFLKQRLRWGQGAMQMWRREGILFTRGLTLAQRLSYLATMLAYFEGWQRAIFYLAPVVVLTTGVMPIAAFDYEFLLHFIPYYLLTFWAFEEVARGYGRSILTEQYNMMRFAVFIAATFGFFLRRLRFIVTPKTMGAADATRRSLWPQYLVLALNAIAIPVGIVMHFRGSDLPLGALIANVMWAAITLGLAGAVVKFALWVASFRRRDYRFPLSMPLRIDTLAGTTFGLATDLSSSGFRLSGRIVDHLLVGDEIEAELCLPTGRLPVHAKVRSIVSGDPAGATTATTAGCEFTWSSAADADQLDMFLFGSDLQWGLNGMQERTPTPIERLSIRIAPPARELHLNIDHRWVPIVFSGSAAATNIGFISRPEAASHQRMLVTFNALPQGAALQAEELTADGPRNVAARIIGESRIDDYSEPVYLYKLAA